MYKQYGATTSNPSFKRNTQSLNRYISKQKMAFNTSSTASINVPSLCLPRVYCKFDESYIERVFNTLFYTNDEYSVIDHIDMVPRIDNKTEEPYFLVFVHFRSNIIKTDAVEDLVSRIERGEEVRLMYNAPWFWKARKNHSALEQQKQQPPASTDTPRMAIDPKEAAKIKEIQREFVQNSTP